MSIYGKLSLLGVSIVSRACKQQVDSLSDAVAYAYIVNDNDLLGEEGYKMLTVSVSVWLSVCEEDNSESCSRI